MYGVPLTPEAPPEKTKQYRRKPLPDDQRWGWWTVFWICWLLAFGVAEGTALWKNAKADGLMDFQHRTLSENLWAWFAYHPDDILEARWGRVRRLAFVVLMVWLYIHITSNGRMM